MTPTPEFPSKIDSSMLTVFDSCKHKFYREYILGLTPYAVSPDLHAGGAMARGFEVMRLELYKNNAPVDTAILAGAWAISDFWGDYEPPLKLGKPHIKSLINVVSAFHEYFEEWPPATDIIKPYFYANGEPAVEFSFAIEMVDLYHPITGDPLLFCGRCDMLGHFQNLFCLVDEKTTTSIGASWADSWSMRGQFLGYCKAAQAFGLPISTALIRGIAFQVKEFKFIQAVVEYPQWQIDRWWSEAHNKVAEMLTLWEASVSEGGLTIDQEGNEIFSDPAAMANVWGHSYGNACESYGGCVFRKDICTSKNPEDWMSEYDIRRWDPLKKNPAIPLLVHGNY
jgi:hypothetical protein